PQSVSKPGAYGCGDWLDNELNALRTNACEGYCTASPASPYAIDDKPTMMAATAGRWTFCGGAPPPHDPRGVGVGASRPPFFLRLDAKDIAVRGTEATYQADYDIFDPRPAGAPPRIDVHLSPTNTLTMDVDAFRCPERVHLRQGERVIDLARFDGHGGTGNPV